MKHGIPYVSSTTFAFNRYSARYMKQSPVKVIQMLLSLPQINKQLQRLRGKGYPVKNILEIVQNDNETNTIVYTSRYFQPCAETFSDRYRFIGSSLRSIQMPMEKTAEKTVYISMGTVNQDQQSYRNCIAALKDTDYQVILSMGTNTEQFENLPGNIQVYSTVDQAIVSIADVFLTHCGMNSASEGIAFQVPLILFPQTTKQGAVATSVEELGAGVCLKSIEKKDILAAVREVLGSPKYKGNATAIAKSFHESGGAAQARAFLESLAQTHSVFHRNVHSGSKRE